MKNTYKLLLTICLISCEHLNAAEFSFAPYLSFETFYNDNVRLEISRNADKIYGVGVTASGRFERLEENSSLFASVKNRSTAHDENSLDSSDQYVDLGYIKSAERSQYQLDFGYIRDTTRTVEVGNTGEVGNERRELFSLSGNISTSLTERMMLQTTLGIHQQDYDKNDHNLIGYDNYYLRSNLHFALNDRLKLLATATYSNNESNERSSLGFYFPYYPFPNILRHLLYYRTVSDSYAMLIGGEYQINEKFRASLTAGRTRQTSENVADSQSSRFCRGQFIVITSLGQPHPICEGGESSSNTTTFNFDLSWRGDRSGLSMRASTEYAPTSNGVVSELHRLSLNYRYKVSELFTLITFVSYYNWDYDNSSLLNTNDYSVANTNLRFAANYKISPHLQTILSYDAFERDNESVSKAAYRNLITLKLAYKPNKTIW